MTQLQNDIFRIVADTIGTEDFDENTKLISAGMLDSYGVMSVITDLEEKFSVEFDLEEFDFEQFNTVVLIEESLKRLMGDN